MKQFLKRQPIAPRAFTANGTATGLITLADTIGFRTGALIVLRTNVDSARGRIRTIVSTTQMIIEPENRQGFLNLSAYTVVSGASIEQMEEVFAPEMEDGQLFQSVYESHPVTAIRTTSVDPYGEPYTTANPLPVDATISVVVPPVEVELDAITPPTRPDPDNVLIVGSEDGTKTGLKHAFVNNLRLQVLDSHDRVADFTYADFGTKNQRITRVDYSSATFPGSTVRRDFTYTLVGNNYRRDDETWTIV